MSRFVSLESRIILCVAMCSLIGIVTIGALAYGFGRTALEDSAAQRLDALRLARAEAVRRYFDQLERKLQILADSPWVVQAAGDFRKGFLAYGNKALPEEVNAVIDQHYTDEFIPTISEKVRGNVRLQDYRPTDPAAVMLQYLYTTDADKAVIDGLQADGGEEDFYRQAHDNYHQRFRTALDMLEVDDVYLVNISNGRVLYSTGKGVDFATDLINGPHARSGLAQAVSAATELRHQGAVAVIDYSDYLPTGLQPAAFLAAPVLDHQRSVGILVVRISADHLTRALASDLDRASLGLGQKGHLYLVGEDGLVRSKLVGDATSAEADEATPMMADDMSMEAAFAGYDIVGEARNDVVERALDGENGTAVGSGQFGNSVLSAYGPVAIGDDFDWAIVAEADLEETARTGPQL